MRTSNTKFVLLIRELYKIILRIHRIEIAPYLYL